MSLPSLAAQARNPKRVHRTAAGHTPELELCLTYVPEIMRSHAKTGRPGRSTSSSRKAVRKSTGLGGRGDCALYRFDHALASHCMRTSRRICAPHPPARSSVYAFATYADACEKSAAHAALTPGCCVAWGQAALGGFRACQRAAKGR